MKTRKYIIRLISAVLALALLAAAVPTTVFAAEKGKINVGVLSDIHYFAPENIDDPVKCEEVCKKTISTTYLADSIIMTALDGFKARAQAGNLDYLLVPGDLTKNGDKVSHTRLASILESFEEDTGVSVLVTNGNHDVFNNRAEFFRNGEFVKGNEITTAEEFREIYKNLGYDLAVEEFEPGEGKEAGGLSYVAELEKSYYLLAIDGGKYSPDNTFSGTYSQETAGKYTADVLDWAVDKTAELSAQGKTVLGLTHWNIVPHFSKEINTFKDFCIVDCERVSELLADAGMNYVFTGHLHVHDIAQHISDNGNIIYDIATASVLSFPHYVRNIEFDNTVSGKLTADIKTYDFDETTPLVYNGTTYEQPFRNISFGINFTGNDPKGMIMDMASYYVEDTYVPQITAMGGLYNFLLEQFDLETVYNDLLNGGVKLGALTIFGSKNLLGLTKNLCDQVDKLYIENPDKVMQMASDLLDSLLNIQVSDVPCTKFYESHGIGTPGKGGTLAEMAASILMYLYGPYEDFTTDPFMADLSQRLETGEISQKVLDALIEALVNDLIQDELFANLRLNISSAFPAGTFGSLIIKGLDIVLKTLLLGDNTFNGVVNFVFKFANVFNILDYKNLNDVLNHLMDEYLTISQFETIDGEIKSFLLSLCTDNNPGINMDSDVVLTADTDGGYPVEMTVDNLRLPSNISVTFNGDPSTNLTFSWFTKTSVKGTNIQIVTEDVYNATGFEGVVSLPAGVRDLVERTANPVKCEYPGVDIGILGILPYSFYLNRHIIKLTGLKPGTVYHYRVGDYAKGYWSEPATIRTADNSDSFTFLHTSDCQSGLEKQYKYGWANMLNVADRMFPEAAFILSTGDQVDQGDNFLQWKWMFNSASNVLMKRAYMPTAGNHEEKGTNAIVNNFVLPQYPNQNVEEGVYYSYDYNNAHFIVLNSNNLNADEGLSDDQIEWLKADASASDAQWKIVAIHKAVYSNGSHYDDDDVIAIRKQLSKLMPQLGIDIVLQGHDHVYLRTSAMNNNKVVKVQKVNEEFDGNSYSAMVNPKGTVYTIDGCSGVKYYQTKNPADTDKLFPRAEAIVNADCPVFSAIRIRGDRLYFDAYGVTGDTAERIDSFEIIKDADMTIPKRATIANNWLAA